MGAFNPALLRLLATGTLLVGACSVVNKFDDVAPNAGGSGGTNTATGGATTGGAGQGGSAGTSAGSGGQNTGGKQSSSGGRPVSEGGSGGESPNETGGTAGGGGESGGAGEAGAGGGGGRPVPQQGLIVVGGTALDGKSGLISVLNPATGVELRRETLAAGAQVAGVAYDGAEGKDVWFFFVSSDFPAKEDKVVNLQVRYFNDRSNTWTTISRVTTLPPPVPGSFAVLNDRLAYLSHAVVNGAVAPSLTILDTTDVNDVKVVSFPTPATSGDMLLLLGTRGTADDPGGLGGTLDLGLAQNCGTTCELFVQPISVGSTVSTGVGHVIGSFRGTPVGAASTKRLSAYFAFAPATGSVVVSRIAPDAPESPTNSNAPPSATDLGGLALAECQQVVVFSADTEEALYGVTGAGIGKTLALGRPGQLVAYEPFSRDAITTYNPPDDSFMNGAGGAGGGPPGPEISAVRVTSPSSSSLTLALRTGAAWVPPDDVRVNALATRIPYPFECP
jgi:hypothetical protein